MQQDTKSNSKCTDAVDYIEGEHADDCFQIKERRKRDSSRMMMVAVVVVVVAVAWRGKRTLFCFAIQFRMVLLFFFSSSLNMLQIARHMRDWHIRSNRMK